MSELRKLFIIILLLLNLNSFPQSYRNDISLGYSTDLLIFLKKPHTLSGGFIPINRISYSRQLNDNNYLNFKFMVLNDYFEHPTSEYSTNSFYYHSLIYSIDYYKNKSLIKNKYRLSLGSGISIYRGYYDNYFYVNSMGKFFNIISYPFDAGLNLNCKINYNFSKHFGVSISACNTFYPFIIIRWIFSDYFGVYEGIRYDFLTLSVNFNYRWNFKKPSK